MDRTEQTADKSIAYSYIRLSSRQQISGDGQRRQIEAAELYCKQNNLTLSPKSFRDLGISAYKEIDRPSLSDLHECIANGSIRAGDVVIIEKLDRLSRQGIDTTTEMLKSILRQGVIVVSLMDGLRLDRNSLNDLTLVIRIAIAADLANKESSAKSIRIQANKDSVRDKIKAGEPVPMKLPFWLKLEGNKFTFDDRRYILDIILERKRQGESLAKIAGHLNSSNIPSPTVKGVWNPSTLRDVIANPILFGAYQLTVKINGKYQPTELVQGYFPAVITYSEFLELNSKAMQRPAGASETNHISGLVFCGCCGKRMAAKSRKNKTAKVTYYYCRYSLIEKCEHTAHVRDLHNVVISNIHHLEVKQLNKQDSGEDALRIKLAQVEKRISDLSSELSNVESTLPISAVMASLTSLEKQKKELMADIKAVVRIAPDAIETLLEHIDDPKKFNIEIKKIVESIVVKPFGNGHIVKISRFDKHSISFHTKSIFKASDSEKFSKMVNEIADSLEEE
ncbi:recombinase family protein [Aeromonas rivipollensis]|uniref:Recombinase family protein n=1 Tax=Aeromonas rivipollensis TaxID=948519 RepID=A0ABX0D5Y2_9GAMM|nr:recombinase family protein [Aeromonas rivipollensis]NEX88870.1 recombinase family protein [Aeromonas rivipollensis]NEY06974.1 recombinase family protein [Aeromonas rivipollensis]